jgi:protein DGCR14
MSCMTAMSGAVGPTQPLSGRRNTKGGAPVDSTIAVEACNGVVAIKRASDGALVRADDVFKRPALPGPRFAIQQKALEEDTYNDSLKTIIERDFFPEVPFLRARQELDEAMKSRDPVRMQEAQANFRRCAMTPGGGSLHTPRVGGNRSSVPGTPLHCSRAATPGSEFGGSMRSECAAHDEEMDRAKEIQRITKGKRLDQFLAKYTSEDNQSASNLLLEDSVRLEQARMWVHEQALEFNTKQQKLIENGPRQEDGTLNMVLSAKYDESQGLTSYVPKTEYQPVEAVSRVGAVKEINTSATRMDKTLMDRLQKAGMTGGVLAAAASGKAGLSMHAGASPAHGGGSSGLPPSVPASPRVGGYGFLVTPSPAPGVDDDAPMFTWGAVEGTPLLLHDDPMPGYQPFKVQEKSQREELAERMHKRTVIKKEARGEFRNFREDANSRGTALAPGAGVAKTRSSRAGSATPSFGACATPVLSEAARKLAAKIGQCPSGIVDKQLRSSYRGKTTPRSSATGAHTPSSVASGTPRRTSALRPTGPVTPRMQSQSPALHRKDCLERDTGLSLSSSALGVQGGSVRQSRASAHLTDGLLQL